MKRSLPCFLVAVVFLLACDRSPAGESPQLVESRRSAARDACAAAEISARAQDNLETLTSLSEAGTLGPAVAALQFARTFANHAELRHAAIARVDSAVNHSRDSSDSLRLMESAGMFRPGIPDQGTVEANVSDAYNRQFLEIRTDDDHRCNWSI